MSKTGAWTVGHSKVEGGDRIAGDVPHGEDTEPHHYTAGEYCHSVGCDFYRDGAFANTCDTCPAYTFYFWLGEHGYVIVSNYV